MGHEDPSAVPVEKPVAEARTRASAAAAPHASAAEETAAPPSPPAAEGADEERPHGDPLAPAGAPSPADGEAPEPEEEGEPEGDHEQKLERDLEELAARAEKADEYLELAQRTKADFENYRKRASREAGLAQERGIARMAKELLPAIDNLDRAVQAADAFAAGSPEAAAAEAESQLASGIKLVHADVLAALARLGIEPFSPAGEPFDPQCHEAVAQHPIEGQASGTVVEVYQQGYRLGEMVLRPARVLVAA
jgi:molecular chaperone GrpE